MKTCPYCNHENQKHSLLCENCGNQIERVSKSIQVYRASKWMAFGGFLVLADLKSVFKLIPIPYGLSMLGAVIFSNGLLMLLSKAKIPHGPEDVKTAEKKSLKRLLIFISVSFVLWILIAILLVISEG